VDILTKIVMLNFGSTV